MGLCGRDCYGLGCVVGGGVGAVVVMEDGFVIVLKRIIFSLVLAIALVGSARAAPITTFLDRTSFDAAVGATTTETFGVAVALFHPAYSISLPMRGTSALEKSWLASLIQPQYWMA